MVKRKKPPEELTEEARAYMAHLGRRRWRKRTKAQKAAHMRMMVEKRWAEERARKQTEKTS